jgi:hypothetical protein
MTPNVRQLFLELCLLRLRYSEADIEQLSYVKGVTDDPQIQKILFALREIQGVRSSTKLSDKKAKRSKASPRREYNRDGIRNAIAYFIERLEAKKILRSELQLENFAHSLGIKTESIDQREILSAIKGNLEDMQPAQALQKMRSVDKQLSSGDSDPYLNLAKTLMRT